MKRVAATKGLEYLQPDFPPFDTIVSGFFTRTGGVSPVPFQSLNISVSTGDTTQNVIENRSRIFEAIEKPISTMFDVWQTHSDIVVCTDTPRGLDVEPQKADAIFTNNPNVTLMMRFADCVPILIFDPIEKVIGIIHAGWHGTVNEIAAKSIKMIVHSYGSKPKNIHAFIGPSICPVHYEVGDNVAREAIRVFPDNEKVLITRGNQHYFDLRLANQEVLFRSGVNNIHQSGICTACNTKDWYSHRAESGKTGRFATIITLT